MAIEDNLSRFDKTSKKLENMGRDSDPTFASDHRIGKVATRSVGRQKYWKKGGSKFYS